MSGIRNGSSYSRSFSNRRRGSCWRTFRESGARVLDLGCGQGNTTRCLADALEPSECIGVEFDATLVEYAQTRPENPPSVRFQQGDATQLPFPDASFDVVFCRYLLIHIADPVRVVSEMMRVVRPGGFVVAYEGDFTAVGTSHPPCAALETIHRVWRGLFQNPPAGRRLVHYLRDAGAADIRAGASTSWNTTPRHSSGSIGCRRKPRVRPPRRKGFSRPARSMR